MNFKVDENLPEEVSTLLGGAGYEADTVADEGLSGVDDRIISEVCRSERRVLVTLDLDFANVLAYPPEEHCGIIVLRTKSQDKRTILALTLRVVKAIQRASPDRQLWIVEEDRVRVRGA